MKRIENDEIDIFSVIIAVHSLHLDAIDDTPRAGTHRGGCTRTPERGTEGRAGSDPCREDEGGGVLERNQRIGADDRDAARADLRAQHGDPAHQREPRGRHRPAGGGRQRPRADRRALRPHRHNRRDRRGPGLLLVWLHSGGAPAAHRVAGRTRPVCAAPRPSRPDPPVRLPRLRRLPRLLPGADTLEDLPGHADAPPRRACRPLLPCREGGGAGVHRRG